MLKYTEDVKPGQSTKKKDKCIFTILRNEPVLLKIWLKNHKKLFDDIYVLFHQSASDLEKSLCEQYGVTYFNIHNSESYCWVWLTDTANKFATFLLNSYELIAFSDVDEIIVDPKNLLQHPESFPDVTRCVSLNVIHDYKNEPAALDFNKPLSVQRPKHIWPDRHWCKPIIKRSSRPYWNTGFHSVKGEGYYEILRSPWPKLPNINMDLFLVHLHYIDIQFFLNRHRHRNPSGEMAGQNGISQARAFFDGFPHPQDGRFKAEFPWAPPNHPPTWADRPAWAAKIVDNIDITPHD
jgi:hypothetical protein